MPHFNVGFVIFPNLTQLDFTGPLQVLARASRSAIHIVAKSRAPVPSDCGLGLVPTHTFAKCPPLDLICVPGGSEGVVAAMGDRGDDRVRAPAGGEREVRHLGLHRRLHPRRRRAAARDAARRRTGPSPELLPLVGATHEKARIVRDGNVITAGGVTSGIDFGLSVVAEIAGETAARTIQLGIEYDPAPPFDSGHPDRAPNAITSGLLNGRYDKARSAYRSGLEKAARP